jgi:hypothetical protein
MAAPAGPIWIRQRWQWDQPDSVPAPSPERLPAGRSLVPWDLPVTRMGWQWWQGPPAIADAVTALPRTPARMPIPTLVAATVDPLPCPLEAGREAGSAPRLPTCGHPGPPSIGGDGREQRRVLRPGWPLSAARSRSPARRRRPTERAGLRCPAAPAPGATARWAFPTPGPPTDVASSCRSTKPGAAGSPAPAPGTLGRQGQPGSRGALAQGRPALPVWLPMMRPRLGPAPPGAVPGGASGSGLRPSAAIGMSCNLLVDGGTAGTGSGYPLGSCPPTSASGSGQRGVGGRKRGREGGVEGQGQSPPAAH